MKKILKIIGASLFISISTIVLLSAITVLGITVHMKLEDYAKNYARSKYPPKSDWHLTTDELFIEYGQRYVDYIEKTIDSYGLEYTFKEKIVNKTFSDENDYLYTTTAVFTDGYQLTTSIYQNKMFNIKLINENENPENVYNIKQEYFDIIYKIGQFCIYDFYGDENTFLGLMEEDTDPSDYRFYNSSYKWTESKKYIDPCAYYATACLNGDGETATVSFSLHAYLTDKNVWDQ